MKTINKFSIILVSFALITLHSCKKDDYLTDGGVHNAQSSLSTYDYLKNHTYHYFDTTILIIDHFNFKDSVNQSGTFFAFTDYSIKRLMDNNGYQSLNNLYDSTSSKLITQYLFGDKNITLQNANINPVKHTSWAGIVAPAAVKKVAGEYNVYLTSSAPAFNYFTLSYVQINGELDGSPGAPPDDEVDINLPCQTTGIITSTGTTLHVLSNTAILKEL